MEQRFTAEIRDIEPRRTILRTYENKDELKNEINKSFAKYISEFDIIPESLKDKRVEEVDIVSFTRLLRCLVHYSKIIEALVQV